MVKVFQNDNPSCCAVNGWEASFPAGSYSMAQMIANGAEDIARSDADLYMLAYVAPLTGGILSVLLLWWASKRKMRPRGLRAAT